MNRRTLIIIMLPVTAAAVTLYGQNNTGEAKIKTITVYEEKFNKLVSQGKLKTHKEYVYTTFK